MIFKALCTDILVLHSLMRAKYHLSLFNATDVIIVNAFFSAYLYKADVMTVTRTRIRRQRSTIPHS